MDSTAPIVLLGYSGHACSVIEALFSQGQTNLAVCDQRVPAENEYELPYLGSEEDEEALAVLTFSRYLVTIGDNALRQRLIEWGDAKGFELLKAVVHQRAWVATTASCGAGTVVLANATVNSLATVGRGVIVNSGAVVEHHCTVGDYAHLAPGVILTGNVTIGTGAFLGAGATVLPGIQIGEWATIGAGAVVTKDVRAGSVVVGSPAKEL